MRGVSKAAAAAALSIALLGCGCQPKPKAPALIDEPVYQSPEGFRFLVPEDWIMVARANLPPGPVEKERLLVQYRRSTDEGSATLEISRMDLPEDSDLAEYLSAPSFSVRRWRSLERAESIEVDGVKGTRFRFSGQVEGRELAREVTAFRRDGRVYFFTVLYSPKDTAAPEQVRRSISRITWTK